MTGNAATPPLSLRVTAPREFVIVMTPADPGTSTFGDPPTGIPVNTLDPARAAVATELTKLEQIVEYLKVLYR